MFGVHAMCQANPLHGHVLRIVTVVDRELCASAVTDLVSFSPALPPQPPENHDRNKHIGGNWELTMKAFTGNPDTEKSASYQAGVSQFISAYTRTHLAGQPPH